MSALIRPFSVLGSTPGMSIVRGEGSHVFDADGRRYLNAVSGLWNVSLGLGESDIIDAMGRQLRSIAYTGLFDGSHDPAERLAERLVRLTDGAMSYAYLSTTGTSAVDVAIRTARIHQRACGHPERSVVLGFDLGYHGCSIFGMSVGGSVRADLETWEDASHGFELIASPDREDMSLDALDTRLSAGDVAAIIVEPVLGSGGIVVPSPSYFPRLGEICAAHGVLVIADEVATGGGRCGAMFASALVGLKPDIVTLSKGLNSGYFPTSATLFSEAVIAPMRSRNIVFQYGSTQDGNPVGCAATLATLTALEDRNIFARVIEAGQRLRHGLDALIGKGAISEVRGLGLMLGVVLRKDGGHGEVFDEVASAEARRLCRDEGLLVYHFVGGLSLFPPLTIDDDDIDEIVDTLGHVSRTLG